jgi:polyhydroxyalkanoate synthesis regulator phasin
MSSDWAGQANQMFKLWSEGQRAWMESFARMAGSDTKDASGMDPAAAVSGIEAWKKSTEQWMALLQQASPLGADSEKLRKVFDPAEWAKPTAGSFDFGFERLVEGPAFASKPELQLKFMQLQELARKRGEDSAAYHAVVLAAWAQATERFMKDMTTAAATAENYRSIIDRWVKIANSTLIEVHRSPKFLEAQQRLTRSATDYRLLEREIAEAFCEINHVPTRTEVDEVQRRVIEMRRELRQLKRQLKDKGVLA